MNKKYHELLEDLDNNFREAINELGNDEAQALLSNRLKPQIDVRKESKKELLQVFVAVWQSLLCSRCSKYLRKHVHKFILLFFF